MERPVMLSMSRDWMDRGLGLKSRILLGRGITQRSAIFASPGLLVALELVHSILELRTQIYTVKRSLVNLLVAVLAVPPQSVDGRLWSQLLQHNADGVCKPHWIVRHVGWKEEHLPFLYRDVAKLAVLDDLEQHVAFVLEEPFRRLVDVVIGSFIGAADDHHCHMFIRHTVIIDRGLKKVGVLV